MAAATTTRFLATILFSSRTVNASMLCACIFASGCDRSAPVGEKLGPSDVAASSSTDDGQTGTVTVEFYLSKSDDDAMQSVEVDYVAADASVESVMRKVESPAVVIDGGGRTAFVSQIGDLKTTEGEGWTYRIDGEFVPLGIGSAKVTPPATITWRHGEWDSATSD